MKMPSTGMAELAAAGVSVVDRTNPPRIAFVSHTADWVGPTNSLTLLLLRLRSRYDVKVLVPGTGDFTDRLREEGIDFRSFRQLDKWDLLEVRRELSQWGADLVYANNTHSSSRIGFLASRLAGVPFVTHVRGMAWDQSWRRMGYLRFADGVVAVSGACGDSVRRFAGADKVVTVYNGIPQERVTAPVSDGAGRVRQELDADAETVVIVSVSHVMPRKGQHLALDAFSKLAGAGRPCVYAMVGRTDRDPDYVRTLSARISREGWGDRVRILGFRRDVMDILDAADVFLHTAVADPHPRSVIEAMARGLPVAAFAVDGVAETVVQDETGVLATKGDVRGLTQGL
ncbi:MAG: glycosyltransferase family 4 protein, partial [Gemmatimonadetes bacterium]|nr:glycosyltransferase family 4 protein [Gemmatimonadota bacterium]